MIDLVKLKNDIENGLNDISQDFVCNWKATDNAYICDAFSEFCDGYVAIYNNDLWDWASNNRCEVEETLDEFGWDGCGKDLMKVFQMAQFREYYNTLYSEMKDIIKYLGVDYLLDNNIELSKDDWDNIKTELSCIDNNDRLERIKEVIDEYKG